MGKFCFQFLSVEPPHPNSICPLFIGHSEVSYVSNLIWPKRKILIKNKYSVVRTFQNYVSTRTIRTVADIGKVNLFRTLEDRQRFTTVQGVLTQEKWLNISQDSELYHVLTQPFPLPSPQLHGSLEKTTALQAEQVWRCKPATRRLATTGGQCRFGAQRTVFLWPVWKLPGKAPLAAFVIVWLDSELTQSKQPSPHGVYWGKKKISAKCLILQLP